MSKHLCYNLLKIVLTEKKFDHSNFNTTFSFPNAKQ